MYSSLRSPIVRVGLACLVLLGSALVGTCTDGNDPAGPSGETRFNLTLEKEFLLQLAPDQVRPIERIRITAEEVPGGSVLGGTTVTVDPDAGQWTVEFSLPIQTGSTATVVLSVELISQSSGSSLVEWSGRTGPLTLRVGAQTDVADIALVKGPLANLAVTALKIEGPVLVLREGDPAQLTATVTTSTPQDRPTIFWRSLNPGVAIVSGEGLVVGVLPGSARVVATAGVAADSLDVRVVARPASVRLSPDEVLLEALGEEVTIEAAVLDPRGQPVPEQDVTWTVSDPAVLRNLGNGTFRSEGRGTALVTAFSSLDPSVAGSAEVVVRQVVTAVQMAPEETSVFFGETTTFEAVALDANERPIEGMTFSWSTSAPSIASVDDSGLATGLAAGTVTVSAAADMEAMGIEEGESRAPTPGTVGMATLEVLPPVAVVVITPSPFTFTSLGQTEAFTAEALDASGSPIPGVSITWASANESVFTVDEDGLATAVSNGEAAVEARVGGVTGAAMVVVDQQVASIEIAPGTWTFYCPSGCEPRQFVGRAFDGLGSRVPDVLFTWSTNRSCFLITAPGTGKRSSDATVNDVCGCDTQPAVLSARAAGVVGTATLLPPACDSSPFVRSHECARPQGTVSSRTK